MLLFLHAHGGSGNHGCEAIVRSTAKIFQDHDILLYSYRPEEDIHYGVDHVCTMLDTSTAKPDKRSLRFWCAYLALKFRHNYLPLNQYSVFSNLSLAPKGSIAFSIGGDNYCYRGAKKYMAYNTHLKKRGHKTVFWGCSVDPELIDRQMRKDISRYDLITARETITFNALKKINPNTILAPDPAFVLPVGTGEFPDGLGKRPFIGINVSPMVQECEACPGITIDNYSELIRYILTNTDHDIALIPHVVWLSNDDRHPLSKLYEIFRDTGRVYMVEDQNCTQIKDIISKCEFFVGARTHSTIAAYSTCVPTLVVGYSVKAKGIARDLFGTEEGYVLPVQSLRQKDDLTNAFKLLYTRRAEIREHLTQIMPGYKAGIQAAREAVEKL